MAILVNILPTLCRDPGRPSRAPEQAPEENDLEAITRAVLRYVMDHPGCVCRGGVRLCYSDGFRQFVLQTRAQNEKIPLDVFAGLVEVPIGTLKTWLAATSAAEVSPAPQTLRPPPSQPNGSRHDVEIVLTAWRSWHGSFGAFVEYVRGELGVPYGRQLIAKILHSSGERPLKRRKGRSPDEIALRKSFETFFPGAQWVGDGKVVSVEVDGEVFALNLELQVDAHSGANVGISISDVEDSDAVVESFNHGISTTGSAPLADLLDNKPCNHTQQVADVLDSNDTLRIRATTKRAQNKAHVEGAFGLFAQTMPTLAIDTRKSKRSVAREFLFIAALIWARTLNHRPRADRGGKTRVELYADEPTEEQILQARHALEERCRKQQLARQTQEARQRPEIRDLLDEHFEQLSLLDPERSVRLAIGRYPVDAIIDGLAIFAAKKKAGTLPENVSARYLLGIVKNIAAKREGECVVEAMIQLRLDAQARFTAVLEATRASVCDSNRPHGEIITDCVRHALDADRQFDRIFWLRSLAAFIVDISDHSHEQHRLLRIASKQILASFRVPPRERQDAIRYLTERVVPLH